jgi:hypothetical protein
MVLEMSDTEIEYSLSLNTEPAYSEVRKLEIVLFRTLKLISRFTGNENLNESIERVMRMITLLRTLQATIRAVQIASGPIGWAYAATSTVMSGLLIYDTVTGV